MELYNYYSEKGREHGMNKEVKVGRSQEETRDGMRQEEALNQKEREQYNKLVLTPISRLIPKLAVQFFLQESFLREQELILPAQPLAEQSFRGSFR